MILFRLFIVFFQTGFFSIGGGYAMIPLISRHMIENGWLTSAEVADVVAISQMTPGPFAINAATFVGMRMAGVPGALCATLGVVLPSIIIVLVIARFFFNFQKKVGVQGALYGMRPAITGLVATAAWTIAAESFLYAETLPKAWPALFGLDPCSLLIAVAVFIAMERFKADSILLIAISAVVGMVLFL